MLLFLIPSFPLLVNTSSTDMSSYSFLFQCYLHA